MSEDYYAVLGIGRDASDEDIRRAYKNIAKKDHPDRNPGDKSAEERFKKANEAYAVLSNVEKKRHYDQWGNVGPSQGGWPAGGDPFSNFQDIFADMFGGGRRRGPSQHDPAAQVRGEDIQIVQRISLKDSMLGCSKEMSLELPTGCDDCGGTGAKKGTSRTRCNGCGGAGHVVIKQGFMSITHPCGKCAGRGDVVETPCVKCRGEGQVARKKKISVTIPPGIDTGQQLRVTAAGVAGRNGGPAGDLYVIVEVEPMSNWRREGSDLVTMQLIDLFTASKGGAVNLELPSGKKIDVTVPAGTQPGTEITSRDNGMPSVRSQNARGNLRVLINVKIPEVTSERGRILLGALEKELASPGGGD